MTWGLPPKFEVSKSSKRLTNEELIPVCNDALKKLGYYDITYSAFTINGTKKLKHSFMSIFAMKKPRLKVFVTATKEGVITIRSTYDYNTATDMAFTDSGRSRKHVTELMEMILDQSN